MKPLLLLLLPPFSASLTTCESVTRGALASLLLALALECRGNLSEMFQASKVAGDRLHSYPDLDWLPRRK